MKTKPNKQNILITSGSDQNDLSLGSSDRRYFVIPDESDGVSQRNPLAFPMIVAVILALIAILLLPGASHAGGRFINHHWYDGNSSYRSHSGRTVIHQNQTFNRNLRSYLKPSYVIQDGVVYGTIPGTDVPSVMRRPIGDR